MKNSEPNFKTTPSKMDLEIAYNDYFLDYTVADSKKFLIEYLKKNNRKEHYQIAKIDDWKIGSCGFTARMLSRGCVLPKDAIDYMENKIKEFCGDSSDTKEIKEFLLTPEVKKAIIDYMEKELT